MDYSKLNSKNGFKITNESSVIHGQLLKSCYGTRFILRNGKSIDIDNIKCPCCGSLMHLSAFEKTGDDSYNETIHSGKMESQHFSQSYSEGEVCFSVKCSDCGSELTVNATCQGFSSDALYDIY